MATTTVMTRSRTKRSANKVLDQMMLQVKHPRIKKQNRKHVLKTKFKSDNTLKGTSKRLKSGSKTNDKVKVKPVNGSCKLRGSSMQNNTQKNKPKGVKSKEPRQASSTNVVDKIKPKGTRVCTLCGYATTHKRHMKEHMVSVHCEERPFTCSHCVYACKVKSNIKAHYHNMHKVIPTAEEVQTWEKVEKTFYGNIVERFSEVKYINEPSSTAVSVSDKEGAIIKVGHMEDFMGSIQEDFECINCEHKAKREDEVIMHYISEHTEKNLRCEECRQSFSVMLELMKHYSDVHPEVTISQLMHEEWRNTDTKNIDSAKNLPCFKKPSLICVNKVKRTRYMKHKPRKIYSCSHCEYTTSHKNHYFDHVEQHSSTCDFPCGECAKQFRTNHSLRQHRRLVHSNNKKQCPKCHDFFLPLDLKNHRQGCMEESNREESSGWVCPVCKITVHSWSAFRKHKQSHTLDERNASLSCQECQQVFANVRNLRMHVENVHQRLKRFQCDQCNREFYFQKDYKIHLKRHQGMKNYSCSECTKQFYTFQELKQHRLVHSGEKPFPCSVCGEKFRDRSTRLRHQKLHQPLKITYNCTTCQRMFVRKDNLITHMRNKICSKGFGKDRRLQTDNKQEEVISSPAPTEEESSAESFSLTIQGQTGGESGELIGQVLQMMANSTVGSGENVQIQILPQQDSPQEGYVISVCTDNIQTDMQEPLQMVEQPPDVSEEHVQDGVQGTTEDIHIPETDTSNSQTCNLTTGLNILLNGNQVQGFIVLPQSEAVVGEDVGSNVQQIYEADESAIQLNALEIGSSPGIDEIT